MDIDKAAQALTGAERILIITGAGLSADSGLPGCSRRTSMASTAEPVVRPIA